MTAIKTQLLQTLASRSAKRKEDPINKAFTLVELMVVIVIVGILAGVALPNFLNQTKKAAATEAKQQVSSIFKQTHAFVLENGSLGTVDKTCEQYAGTLTTIKEGAGFSYECGGSQAAFEVTATGDTDNTNTNKVVVKLTGNCDKGTVASITTTGV
ncbi:prepilin-type N-terminal cleavage/methylation domain-containing protein [bacterium]|nr:prepilin-type N-terminal cleavage/methylation domain-containing protein [bacterium]